MSAVERNSTSSGDSNRAIMEQLNQLLGETIERTDTLISSMRIVPRTTTAKVFQLVTVNDMLHKAKSVSAMLRGQAYGGVGVTVRSLLESRADLICLFRNPNDHPNCMHYLSVLQQLRIFKAYLKNPKSAYSEAVSSKIKSSTGKDFAEIVDELQELLDELSRRLPKAIYFNGRAVNKRIDHRFNLAGLTEEYESVYRHLSAPTHGDVGTSATGAISKDGWIWPPEDRAYPLAWVNLCIAIVIDSGVDICKRYRRPVTHYRTLEKQHHEIFASERDAGSDQ